MNNASIRSLAVAALALLAAGPVRAEEDCTEGPEGRICRVQQSIINGDLVSTELQQSLGLVTVAGGCSGTLINRSWVLTADHCVSADAAIGGPDKPFGQLPVTAAWSTKTVIPTRYVRYFNSHRLDIALIHLGPDDFGPVNTQLLHVGTVDAGAKPPMTLTKYGRGISVYARPATPSAAATPSFGDRLYRSARFNPASGTNETTIVLPVNAPNQVGAGGDSGGPDHVTGERGVSLGIASVLSTCDTKYVPGMPQVWAWATEISLCTSASIETIRWEIIQEINGNEPVKFGGRVKDGAGPSRPICIVAREARARNSPAAPGLEAQCVAYTAEMSALAAKGPSIAGRDPEALELRSKQANNAALRGFDIGMAAAEGQTEPGPGKQALRDSLQPAEQVGFDLAVSFSLARNKKQLTDLASKGQAVASADPLAVALRQQQPDGPAQLGFDIGMAAAEGQTAPGPGKQRIRDSLRATEQPGFDAAVRFSLDRNRNAKFAAVGAAIAETDPIVGRSRNAHSDAFYRLGFDIATGIFGDPARGAQGNTQTGPGSLGVRDALSAAGQRGFDVAVSLHLSRNYRP